MTDQTTTGPVRLPLRQRLNVPVVTAFGCIIVLLLVGSIYSPNFLSPEYLLQQLKVGAFLGIIATGMMLVILLGQIDLSVPWTITVGAMMASAATAYGPMGEIAAIPFGILCGVLIGLLNGRAKRLGDLLAGTYSQHERIPLIVTPVYGVPTPLIEWSKTADVARMPDALSRRIAHYLAQARGLSPETRVRLGRELANEASIYVSPLPTVDAELFLAAVASLRRDREFAALQLEKRRMERLRPVLGGLPHKFPRR